MRVLITGSSGQIGTNLALKMIEEGHTVYGVDQRPNTWTAAIPTQIQDLGINYTDFAQGIGNIEYPADLDMVVHLAADAKVHDLVKEPQRALKNIIVTFNVLEYCRHHHLPLIFSSTREVYGDIHRYTTEESSADFAFTESPYSASKISGEALIYSYARCYDLPYLVFRFSNVYGRYDSDIQRMERVIPLFIDRINQRQPITIYGKDKVLDFTYIDDCVDGIYRGITLLHAGQVSNQTINLAYGEGNSLMAMAGFIGQALGISPQIDLQPTRVGEVTRYVADISKARSLLGYNPVTPLEEGIAKAVRWSTAWWAEHGYD